MHPVRRAVIDVGTNSVKLLIADISGRDVRPIHEESRQTRLGKGFYLTRHLQTGPIEQTAEAVADFTRTARSEGAQSVRVVATSAARDANNAEELKSAITRASGLEVEVISGEEEADLAFRGVASDPSLREQPLLIIDTGGGSTEFILGCGQHKQFSGSWDLGTVRLLESIPHSDPPRGQELANCRRSVEQFLKEKVEPRLGGPIQRQQSEHDTQLQLVGTGGTASILGCMQARLQTFDRQKLEATRIPLEQLRWHTENLWSLPLSARRQIPGLPPNRADVILMGAVIYENIASLFGFAELRISTRGLRFGALLED